MAFTLGDDLVCPSCENADDFRYQLRCNDIYIPVSGYFDLLQLLSTEQCDTAPVAKKRRIQKSWTLWKAFSTKEEAVAALKEERIWSYHYVNDSKAGRRYTYRCNLAKFRGKQCEAAIVLFYSAMDTSVHFF